MSIKYSSGTYHLSKSEDIEVAENGRNNISAIYDKNTKSGWICCVPCVWMRTSRALHRIAITTATLLVTSLLVASPILFLISTAPSQLPRDCYVDNENCIGSTIPSPQCEHPICRIAARSIQSKLNYDVLPCSEFKNFSCSQHDTMVGMKTVYGAQESVDLQIQQLLQHNTTFGHFRKLGRLFGSCLKQNTNSSTIRILFDQLGGYLPIGALGPSGISHLISKMHTFGPTPIVDMYYDLSYGKHPHALLIISGSSVASPILEDSIRWTRPKSPPVKININSARSVNKLLSILLPSGLSEDQMISEKENIFTFIKSFNNIRNEFNRRDYWDSSVLYNITSLERMYPVLNWASLIPKKWTGPIIVRSSDYLKSVQNLLTKYPTRVAHNSMLLLFVIGLLPHWPPNPHNCARATMWALPDVTSALFLAQHSKEDISDAIKRTDIIFKSLKAHLKRAPSLKGAALVKLSALKIQARPWENFFNLTTMVSILESLEITADNWFENILKIYLQKREVPDASKLIEHSQDTWAYPIVAKTFYDALSHSIVVPLSIILDPYFNTHLPPYAQYASVGVAIAKEILRSITKSFEEKAMKCVPKSVNVFSNYSRMDILIHSGGLQISYHSMLSLTGPTKGMLRLPGLNLTPTQIFFLITAQELCSDSEYAGIDTTDPEFEHILGWLIAQGGSATEAFKCPIGSMIYDQKTCNVL